MQTLREVLSEVVRTAAGVGVWPEVLPCRQENTWDFQWNGAFQVVGRSPVAVAEEVASRVSHPVVECAEAVGGFVNLRLSSEWLGTQALLVARDPLLLVPQFGENRRVMIDFSSPNIAKRMHVGHLRSTVIGAAIDRLYRHCGFDVISDNHIGDWGTPFGKLFVALDTWASQEDVLGGPDPIGRLQALYTHFEEESADDPRLGDAARDAIVRLQQGSPKELALWERIVAVSMTEFQTVYDRLGVSFDIVMGESKYADLLPGLVDRALKTGVAISSRGAVIVPLEGFNAPLLLQKKDGAYLYATTDLATIGFRVDTQKPLRIVYVTDKRQSDHFKQVFATASKLYQNLPELIHVGFGLLRLPENGVMASRGKNAVPLAHLLEEAVQRAWLVVRDTPNTETERTRIAEAVGVSTVVYADLSRDPSSDIQFDWDRALSLEGNTAAYLMYALARCHGILRAAGASSEIEGTSLNLEHPSERALAVAICRMPDVFVAACEAHRPDYLATHLYKLAGDLARFHASCRVIAEGQTNPSRLDLVRAVARTFEIGFRILGIRTLSRM